MCQCLSVLVCVCLWVFVGTREEISMVLDPAGERKEAEGHGGLLEPNEVGLGRHWRENVRKSE